MSTKIAIIGAGNLGIALAQLFNINNYEVILGARDIDKAERDTKQFSLSIRSPKEAVKNADISVLTVSDSAIQSVCNELEGSFKSKSIVTHCSGALDSQVLTRARINDCYICSSHPLNTFPNKIAATNLLSTIEHNTYLYCEGDAKALLEIERHFNKVGFHSIVINTSAKTLYHTACVFACNYLTVLMELSLQTAEAAELDRDLFWQSLQPLIQSTLSNINQHGTIDALSGPIARADIETLNKHINELESVSPELRNSYTDMAAHAVLLTLKKSLLSPEKADKLNEFLQLISE